MAGSWITLFFLLQSLGAPNGGNFVWDAHLDQCEPIANVANDLEEIDANNIDLNFVPSKLQATKIDGTKFSPKNDYVFDFDFADGTNSRLPKSRLMFKNSSSIPIDECSTNESDDSKSE